MSNNDLTFEEYLGRKDEAGIHAFVFLLGDEYSYLSQSAYWSNHLAEKAYVVRLTEDEFHSLDVGKHPKTFVYKDGKEKKHYDGVPDLTSLRQYLKDLRSHI